MEAEEAERKDYIWKSKCVCDIYWILAIKNL